MIIVAIILGIIIGSILGVTENLSIFYVLCVGIVVVAHAYFLKSTRLSLKTIAKSSKRFKIILVAVAFAFTVFGFINFTKVMGTQPSTFSLISAAGMLASGFSLLAVIIFANRSKFQNQLAASVSTIPILWLVFELIVIFKDNLSNPYIGEYILAIFIYISTSLAIYYFSSGFCVADKTNRFKEFYVLSVFVCIVYAIANSKGYVSNEDISPMITIGSCAMLNVFMLPYYIIGKPFAKKVAKTPSTSQETEAKETTKVADVKEPTE